jgi:Asp-tRNA(Asn)/Glu-tRNA(Gln) amidotransferase A subunit family amidase
MRDVSGCWKLDIAAVARDISTRSLSPVTLTEMMLDRIARIDRSCCPM